MKTNRLIRFLILLLIPVAFSCKKESVPIGDPFDNAASINGVWVLDSVAIVDETTATKLQRDITRFFKKAPSGATTELTINGADFTYSVVPGSGKNFFGTGGTWAFKNSTSPEFNNMAPDIVVFITNTGDTVNCRLGAALRPFTPTLELKYVRTCNLSEAYDYAGYKHTFKRKN